MKTININKDPVELYKILKFEALVSGGGEAKIVITEGMVKVNGSIETQKRKKIRHGDIIEFDNEKFLIQFDGSDGSPMSDKIVSDKNTQAPTGVKPQSSTLKPKVKKPKRKPIRF